MFLAIGQRDIATLIAGRDPARMQFKRGEIVCYKIAETVAEIEEAIAWEAETVGTDGKDSSPRLQRQSAKID